MFCEGEAICPNSVLSEVSYLSNEEAFSNVCVLGNLKRRLRVDARRKRKRKYAFTGVNV